MDISELELLSYDHPVLFYDGVCHLCDGFVNRLIPRDKKERFLFCPLQSDTGELVMKSLGLGKNISSVLMIHQGRWYYKSDVSIKILSILGGPWNLFLFLRFIPKAIRNRVYDWVARNRYLWFGRSEQCIIPDASIQKRFLL